MVKAKKRTAAKKTVTKKTAKKAPPKTTAKKKTTKKTTTKREKKDGLRKPQIRILKALAKTKKPLTRAQIATKAPVDVATCVEYIGSPNLDIRKANDQRKFPSLVSLGFVKQELHDIDGKDKVVHSLTAAGRKEAAKN